VVALRCLLVDDSTPFLEAASRLLDGNGLDVVAVASTSAEARARVRELEPDVALIDVDLAGESGFELAWQLAAANGGSPTRTIMMSTRSESDLADLVAITPVLGFISKSDLSVETVRDFLADRSHGHGCRHEALVYSSSDELAAGSLQFLRQGLAGGDDVLVVLRERGRTVLQRALGGDAAEVEYADALAWYRSPEHAFEQYTRYLDDHLERGGAPRVRVVAEVIWPQSSAPEDIAAWKRYEAGISAAMAAVPVSFICAYDAQELSPSIVSDARRTHHVLRTADGARPNARYSEPGTFVRGLEGDMSDPTQSVSTVGGPGTRLH